MALSTTPIDVNSGTTGVNIPAELSDVILGGLGENSAVMQLANRVNVTARGVTMNVITGDPEPEWVEESTEKPVGQPTFANKELKPYTLSVIVPFSNQIRDDYSALYEAVSERLPRALGRKFDRTVLQGTGAPDTNFDTLADCDAVAIDTDTYTNVVGGFTAVAEAGGEVNGAILSPQGNGVLMTARTTSGDLEFPGFAPNQPLLGVNTFTRAAAYQSGTPSTLGFVGDWSQAYYGIVGDVELKYSEQATLNDGTNTINLWQRNMFAILAEVQVGFVVTDDSYFARYTTTA